MGSYDHLSDGELLALRDELRYQTTKHQGPPLPVKAAATGGLGLLSGLLRGGTLLTPGQGKTDTVLNQLARKLEGVKPDWQRAVAESASGSLWGSGAGETWSTLTGQHVPLVGLMAGLHGAGALGGVKVGAALGAPAGPIAALGGATVGGLAGAATSLAGIGLIESGDVLRWGEAVGIDQDLAEKGARLVGPINGVIEELQYLGMIGPTKQFFKTGGKAGAKALGGLAAKAGKDKTSGIGTLLARSIVGRVAREAGIDFLEGVEEFLQGGTMQLVQRWLLSQQKGRKADWKPAIPLEEEDLLRQGIIGFGLAAITRGGQRVALHPAYVMRARKVARELMENQVKDVHKTILEEAGTPDPKSGAPPQRSPVETKAINTDRPEIDVAPLHFRDRLRAKAEGWDREAVKTAIQKLKQGQLRLMARRLGIPLHKSETIGPRKDVTVQANEISPVDPAIVDNARAHLPATINKGTRRVYHRSTNTESLRKGYEMRVTGISFGRDAVDQYSWEAEHQFGPSPEELSSPTLAEPQGKRGRVYALLQGLGLDYNKPTHKAFIDHLVDQQAEGVADAISVLRQLGVDWVDSWNSIGFSAEVHVLNPNTVQIVDIQEFGDKKPKDVPVQRSRFLKKPKVNPFGTRLAGGKTDDQLKQELIQHVEGLKEGPTMRDGKIVLSPPQLLENKISEDLLAFGKNLEATLDRMAYDLEWQAVPKVEKAQLQKPTKNARISKVEKRKRQAQAKALTAKVRRRAERRKWELRALALEEAGFPTLISQARELNPLGEGKNREKEEPAGREARETYLTAPQYSRYISALEHQFRNSVMLFYGEELYRKPLAAYEAAMFNEYGVGSIQLKDAKFDKELAKAMPKRFPQVATILHHIRPFLPLFLKVQNVTGLRLMNLDEGIQMRDRSYNEAIARITEASREILAQVPTDVVQGGRRRLFKEGAAILMMDKKERSWALKQLGLKQSTTDLELAQRVLSGSPGWSGVLHSRQAKRLEQGGARWFGRGEKTPPQTAEMVLQHMERVAGDFRQYYNWFYQQGSLTFEMFRRHYVPLVRRYLSEQGGEKAGTTWADWMAQHRKSYTEKHAINKAQWEEMINFGDSSKQFQIKGQQVMQAKPFFEYARDVEIEFLKTIGATREMDLEALFDLYARRSLRKFYFDDIVPSVAGILHNFSYHLQQAGVPDTAIRQIVGNYLDSVLGIPSATTKLLREVNLRSDTFIFGKLMNNTMSWWNDRYGHLKEWQDFYSPNDAINAMTTTAYAYFLGLPLRFTPPIKNIATQNVMSAVLGMKTYLQGMVKLNDPEFRKWLDEQNFRPEFPLAHSERFLGRGTLGKFARHALYVYWVSDKINVFAAAAGAQVAWDRLQSAFAQDPTLKGMTLQEFTKILFQGHDPKTMNLDTAEVLNRKLTLYDKEHFEEMGVGANIANIFSLKGKPKGAPRAMRGLAEELFERVGNGKQEEARRMFLQYMVNLTQWRYGPGGSPRFLGNPLLRMMFMFSTWPINYMEYMGLMMNPRNGMLRNEAQIMMSQLAIASILCGLGFSAHDWILEGPIPDEIGFTGPWVSTMNEILGAFKASLRAGKAETLPTLSTQQRSQAASNLKSQWSDLFDDKPSFVTQWEKLAGTMDL